MLNSEIFAVCYEIRTKHENCAVSSR